MSRLKKILKIVVCNILIFILCFYILETVIYNIYSENKTFFPPYPVKHPSIHFIDFEHYFTGENNEWFGRKPEGREYNSTPIVVFGCSFAYGQYLDYNRIFSYKLSHFLKRPVYNRAIPAGGFQHMYYQADSEEFYKSVPDTDTVFYILIEDHYRRIIENSIRLQDSYVYLKYFHFNNKLYIHNYDNVFLNFLKYSYTLRFFTLTAIEQIISKRLFEEQITDNVLAYFVQTRSKIEEHWKHKVKFIVVFYNSYAYNEKMKQLLKDNDFVVIDTRELTNENLHDEKYMMMDTMHPKETAWDLLTPLIIEKSGL